MTRNLVGFARAGSNHAVYGVGLKPFSPSPKSAFANGVQAQLGHPLALRSSGQRMKKERGSGGALVAVCRAAPVVLREPDANDFWHLLDRQNTLLWAILGLNELVKALLGLVTEQVMLLDNIRTSVLVAENQIRRYDQKKLYD